MGRVEWQGSNVTGCGCAHESMGGPAKAIIITSIATVGSTLCSHYAKWMLTKSLMFLTQAGSIISLSCYKFQGHLTPRKNASYF